MTNEELILEIYSLNLSKGTQYRLLEAARGGRGVEELLKLVKENELEDSVKEKT